MRCFYFCNNTKRSWADTHKSCDDVTNSIRKKDGHVVTGHLAVDDNQETHKILKNLMLKHEIDDVWLLGETINLYWNWIKNDSGRYVTDL